MLLAIEDDIKCLSKETDDSVNSIILGSDDHLDIILTLKNPIAKITGSLARLNESIFDKMDTMNQEFIKTTLLPGLLDLNKSCLTLIGAVKTSFLYRDVRSCLKDYAKQHDILREIIHDLHHFRVKKDAEFDDLLADLNDL